MYLQMTVFSVTVRNDIALVELSRAANTAENHINTICLSDRGFAVGKSCIVAGWGTTSKYPFLAVASPWGRSTSWLGVLGHC